MIHIQRRVAICRVLLVLNVLFIWGNSAMTAEVSGAISGLVGQCLQWLFHLPVGAQSGGHGILRKVAHFTEFACLGGLLFWRVSMAGQRGKTRAALVAGAVLLTACADETIQIFVPGRASSLIDVWIDWCGGLTGMLLLFLGYHLIRKRHG